jgi:hypothetical protein
LEGIESEEATPHQGRHTMNDTATPYATPAAEMAAHLSAVLERAQAYAADNRRNMQQWISRACPKSAAPAIEADAVAMYGHCRKFAAQFATPRAAADYAAALIAAARANVYTVPATMSAARGAVRRAAMAGHVDARLPGCSTINQFAVCRAGEHRACYR